MRIPRLGALALALAALAVPASGQLYGPRENALLRAELGALPSNTVVRLGSLALSADASNRLVVGGGGLVVDGPNDIVLSGAPAGSDPTIAAAGADANPGLVLAAKGSGTITLAASFVSFGLGNQPNSTLVVNGAAASRRSVAFQSGGSARWQEGPNAAAETGSNAGSDYEIAAYSDAGALLSTPLSIARATGRVTMPSGVAINGGTIDGAAIGNTAPAGGAFSTLSASSTVSGTGFSTYLASPPAIGGTTANTGRFTTLTATGKTLASVATGVSAAGTTQATGTAVASDVTVFSTVASGAGGTLSGAAVGAVWEVYNRGANALLVYPPSGYTTDALAANAAYSIAAGAARRFRAVSGTSILSSAM